MLMICDTAHLNSPNAKTPRPSSDDRGGVKNLVELDRIELTAS